ncbi:hypothetical protein [Burkholderia sp. WSM2232]|uniref:hypothetical protein n=1 Tax=Burkholderia sp. WSM2232 TaxID=944436 RepID=UPI0004831AAD|nr:hypothetical protein [Burkholderia sp. WSM2232]
MTDALNAINGRKSELLSQQRIRIQSKTYRIADVDGSIRVVRENRAGSRWMASLRELFSHRLREGALNSRATRLQRAFNARRQKPAESAPQRPGIIATASAPSVAHSIPGRSGAGDARADFADHADLVEDLAAEGTLAQRMIDFAVQSVAPGPQSETALLTPAAMLWTALANHLQMSSAPRDIAHDEGCLAEALKAAAILAETEHGFGALRQALGSAVEVDTPVAAEALRIYLQTHAQAVASSDMAREVREAALAVFVTDSAGSLTDDQLGVYWAWRQGFREDQPGGQLARVRDYLLDLPEWVDLAEKRGANPDVRWYVTPFRYVRDSVRTVFGAASPLSAMKQGFANAEAPTEARRKQQVQASLIAALTKLSDSMVSLLAQTVASGEPDLKWNARAALSMRAAILDHWADANQTGLVERLTFDAAAIADITRRLLDRYGLPFDGTPVRGSDAADGTAADQAGFDSEELQLAAQLRAMSERMLKRSQWIDIESLAKIGDWVEEHQRATDMAAADSMLLANDMQAFRQDVDTVRRLVSGVTVAQDLNAQGLKSAIAQFLQVASPGNEVSFGSATRRGLFVSPGLSLEYFAGVTIEPTLGYARERGATVTVGASESGGGFVSVIRATSSEAAAGLAANASVGVGSQMVVALNLVGEVGVGVGRKKRLGEGVTVSLRGEGASGEFEPGAGAATAVFEFFADARTELASHAEQPRDVRARRLWNQFAREFFERDVSVSLTDQSQSDINGRVFASARAQVSGATGLLAGGPTARLQVAGQLTPGDKQRSKTGIERTVIRASGYAVQANVIASATQSVPWQNELDIDVALDNDTVPGIPLPLRMNRMLTQAGYRDILRMHSRSGRTVANASFREREFYSHEDFRRSVEGMRASWQAALGEEQLATVLKEIEDVSDGWGKRYVARHRLSDAAAARIDEVKALRRTIRIARTDEDRARVALQALKQEEQEVLDDDTSWRCCGLYVKETKVSEQRSGGNWLIDLSGRRSAAGTRRLAEALAASAQAVPQPASIATPVPVTVDTPAVQPEPSAAVRRAANSRGFLIDLEILPRAGAKRGLDFASSTRLSVAAAINDFRGITVEHLDDGFARTVAAQAA